jgi:hypothetical protein
VVEVVTVTAGLGSGHEGCQPLLRARGTGGGKVDGCGRLGPSASGSHRFSWRALTMLRESVVLPSRYGGLAKGFMMPGTDMVNVKGKNMTC